MSAETAISGLITLYDAAWQKANEAFNDADDHFSWFFATYVHDPILDAFVHAKVREATSEKDKKDWRRCLAEIKAQRKNGPITALRGKEKHCVL